MPDLDRLKSALSDRYEIEREIGQGGMATVYLAQDLKHHRQVALKVLRPELSAALGSERFLQEIEIAANLTHPHILPLYDSGETDGFLYYVMPYIKGQTLRQRVAEHGELPVHEAVKIIREVVDALAYAHEQGVVHRDIKPDNVMLSGRHALVMDFGVAKAVSEATGRNQLTTAGVALGTPAYMSPEQATADPHIDHRADIYAVGALAYELLTGRPPFTGATPQAILAAHVTEQVDPVRKHRDHVSPELEALVMRCLEKKPSDRWQSAEELLPQLEVLSTPSGGVTPTDTRPIAPAPAREPRTKPMLIAAAAVIVVGAAATLLLRAPSAQTLDRNLLVVAPFDVLDPDLGLWREGLVDMLSASLDGAGPLRTVSPSTVIRRWTGRADPASASNLGKEVGAGLAVYGRLIGTGEDSVRLSATLFDVEANTPIGEAEFRGRASHLDRLADSLAASLLSDLADKRAIGSLRLSSLGSASPAALRQFLQGEQHFRRSSWDSALSYYEEAIRLDSTFALAFNRLGYVRAWGVGSGPSDFEYAIRAGDLISGLARRESLLVTSDSIYAAIEVAGAGDSVTRVQLGRLFSTLERATQLYPRDPGAWYRLGEAHFHMGYAGYMDQQALTAFSRSVELDSGFAPAYIHLMGLKLKLEGAAAGREAIEQYLALNPTGAYGEAAAIARAVLDPARSGSSEVQRMLDTASSDALGQASFTTLRFADSAESSIRLWRAARSRASPADSAGARRRLARQLAYRGHLAEAYELTDRSAESSGLDRLVFSELVRSGAVPATVAEAVFADAVRNRQLSLSYFGMVSWWVTTGDTASISRAIALFNSLIASDTLSPSDLNWANLNAKRAAAFMSLARRDTLEALRRLTALPVSRGNLGGFYERLTRAELLVTLGRDREAAEILDQNLWAPGFSGIPTLVLWALERARVNERLGNAERAIPDYSHVVDVWRNADDILQPFVSEAREALQRLTGEPAG